jgi:hypothetical protein
MVLLLVTRLIIELGKARLVMQRGAARMLALQIPGPRALRNRYRFPGFLNSLHTRLGVVAKTRSGM